ncbi:MAG: xylulose kinase [Actinobacteria bacterium]|nr:xylulose kinase [Actinomycetota bacterium]
MSEKYLAGIDIGTTGAKVAIFDINGNMVSSGYREYSCIYPKPGWVDQDLKIMYKAATEASSACIEKARIKTSEIAAISVSAQRSCTIFVDKAGDELIPMISWQDGRTTAEVTQIKETFGAEKYYLITGLPLGPAWILPKILWIRKNYPEIWKNTAKVVQLHDYFLKKLGCEDFTVDIPDTAFYGLWDTDRLEWSGKLLENFNLNEGLFSRPSESGSIAGKLSKSAAKDFGFAQGTPLCTGAGDQNSAVVGAGVINEGDLSIAIGTGGIAITYLDKPFRDPNMMNMITNHAITGKWQMEGLQNGAAGVFRWFRDEIALFDDADAGNNDKKDKIYKMLDKMIADTPSGSKGLLMLPYFAGSAAPRWNSDARGTIIGLTFAHDKACLARCFMEGITLEMKDIINSIKNSGIKVKSARLIGGAAKSDIWNRIQCDMYNMNVSTLKVSDAAILGAAILAGVGSGLFGSIREGVNSMVAADKNYIPGKDSQLYQKLYDIYVRAYASLAEGRVFNMVSELQSTY